MFRRISAVALVVLAVVGRRSPRCSTVEWMRFPRIKHDLR